jgi:hypothetical protein
MREAVAAILLVLAAAGPAPADVTLKTTTGSTAPGAGTQVPGTIYIQGNRMRSDLHVAGSVKTTIFDVDAQKVYTVDSASRKAHAWDMEAFTTALARAIDPADVEVSIVPNGRTKSCGDHTATGYGMAISVAGPGGTDGPSRVIVTLTGELWVVKGAPGAADYSRFYGTAAAKGWVFGDPRAAVQLPGPARAIAEMYRHVARMGGIVYESEIHMRIASAPGSSAGPAAPIGQLSTRTIVEVASTDPLPDALFEPPPDYRVTVR